MSALLNHPMVTEEQWENFTSEDHKTWELLFARQASILKDRAAPEILLGMQKLAICHDKIPKFSALNTILEAETGFTIVPVTGLIPEDLFFTFLSMRKFPSTCFIRTREQMDYLEEPDIFHDVFGHVPLLVNPTFANFMQAFGKFGLDAIKHNQLKLAAALYWFTVEFGLIQTKAGLRIYGAGITSSKGESIYALESAQPLRLAFDALTAMHTPYEINCFQQRYFVIDHFQQLFEVLNDIDWAVIPEAATGGRPGTIPHTQ